jgi:dienelactone hydrolase
MTASTDYLAKPSGACCVKGVIYDGEPRGKFVSVGEIETYISEPEEGKANGNVLLYFSDIFGMGTTNTLIMDSYAGAGYLVLGLDYFRKVGRPLGRVT